MRSSRLDSSVSRFCLPFLPSSFLRLVSPICQVEGKQLGDGSRAQECRCMFSDSSAITERHDAEDGGGGGVGFYRDTYQ